MGASETIQKNIGSTKNHLAWSARLKHRDLRINGSNVSRVEDPFRNVHEYNQKYR